MKTKRKIVSILLTLVMLFTMALPATVKAQIVYDPQAEGNHGIYIDTIRVPNDENISVSSDGKIINAKRNVFFKLYCSVDAQWEIQAADPSNTSVEDGDVSISVAGIVAITNDAKGGNYTIKATAENVANVDTATIKLNVDNVSSPARAKDVKFDAEKMENSQMKVSKDGKTLTIDGKVENEKLAVKYSPEYLLDNEVSFSSTSVEAYELSGNNSSYITSNAKATGTIIRCTVGSNESNSIETDLNVAINEKNMAVDFSSEEITGNNYNYTMNLDQKVHFNVTSNENESLPERKIELIKWTLRQDDQLLEAAGSTYIDGEKYNEYIVYGSDGRVSVKVATVYVVADTNVSDKIIVETEKSTSATTVNAVTLSGQVSTDIDNAGNNFSLNTVTLNFNTFQTSSPSKAFIDFEKAGYEKDVDFTVKKENLGGVTSDVYYFESNGGNLDLADATFADVPGVRSFEESKEFYFSNRNANATYKINYELRNLADSVFGSAGTAKMYNNNGLKASELDSAGLLVNNNVFTKQGIGYKMLTVQCMRGTTEISKISYILRFVSGASELNESQGDSGLKISKNSVKWYATWLGSFGDVSLSEVVHIRRGEAVIPGFYKYSEEEGRYIAEDAISIYDPYVEYSVSNGNIGSATPNIDGTYRINGLESGIVTVTAVGAVNKNQEVTFEIYVNKDIYEGRFEINFKDAISNKQMNSAYVVNGKQTDIPVNTNALETNMGIPVLKWSLDCDSSVATINPNTGAITTKASSLGKQVTVTASSASGLYSASQSFTIADVEGVGIVNLAEKTDGSTSIVTPSGDNAGSCKVGNSFTLYPLSYSPVNATRLSGTITWTSSNPDIATVNDRGLVTALAQTPVDNPVKITAAYTPMSGGATVETVYSLTVSGFASPITNISANSLTFKNENASAQSIDLTFTPSNTPNKMVKYVTSDSSVATVSENGLVTPIGEGNCYITITSLADPTVSTTINITVYASAKTTLTLSRSSATIYRTGKTTIRPIVRNSSAKTTFRSSNTKVAKVSKSGVVTGVKAGTARITVTNNNVSKTFYVTVKNPRLSAKSKTLKVKKSYTLKVIGKIGKAKFTSSKKRVATVSSKGKITAKKKGTAIITVKTNGITLKCKVKVKKK